MPGIAKNRDLTFAPGNMKLLSYRFSTIMASYYELQKKDRYALGEEEEL
jgi:hypothetical protein